MNNFSDSWRQLKGILTAYADNERRPELPTLADHQHAKAMSIFLVNATLATPSLDRTTVANILAGGVSWPAKTGANRFHGVDIPLSFFEDNGFVSFYAGWCVVHCKLPRNTVTVDPTLTGLIEAIEHLSDIQTGRGGLVRPHYESPAKFIDKLVSVELETTVKGTLPDLGLEDGKYHLPPGNEHFSPLICTYLWQALFAQTPSKAFGRWITILRVNCGHAMSPIFELLQNDERSAFNDQLLEWLADDTALEKAAETLQKQSVNKQGFESIVSPTMTKIQINIGLRGTSSPEREQVVELEKPTITSLASAYNVQTAEGLNDFQKARRWDQYQRHSQSDIFYTGLVGYALTASIRIDGQVLASSGLAETMLELAATRPVLKYLLFQSLARWNFDSFRLFLLSRPQTSAVALFYLTEFRNVSFSRARSSSESLVEKGYLQLVYSEFVRAIEKEPDVGDRLLEVVEYLSGRVNLALSDFSQQPEYLLLFDALNSLGHKQVLELGRSFVVSPASDAGRTPYSLTGHRRYLVGFWLIDRLDNTGIDTVGEVDDLLKQHLFSQYKTEFNACLDGSDKSLAPTFFFSTLPWHKLVESTSNFADLLALSQRWTGWIGKLIYTSEQAFNVASAIRQYLQILMLVGRRLRTDQDHQRVSSRVMELVRHLGFGEDDNVVYLFNSAFYLENYDLWKPFCSYTNEICDSLFDDFVEQCATLIRLDQLYVLLERTSVVVRNQKLQSEIDKRSTSDIEKMSLNGLEQAFISACNIGNVSLAGKILLAAKAQLREPRFSESTHPISIQKRKNWANYEYMWELLDQSVRLREDPDAFVQFAGKLPIPHEATSGRYDVNSQFWRDCNHFRRYVVAASYLESNPEKCVQIMEALCRESDDEKFRFLLLQGRVVIFERNQESKDINVADLRRAVSQFLDSCLDMQPSNMPNHWAAVILNAYRLLRDVTLIGIFWGKLTVDQQRRAEILYPFCKAQIADGDPRVAQRIIEDYMARNDQATDSLALTQLIDEVAKALPGALLPSSVVQGMMNASVRSNSQLARDYGEIVSKDFSDYVEIVGGGRTLQEFLMDVVKDIGNELLVRKKNLLIHVRDSGGNVKLRLTKEDLVNDWFTSLFNKRMSEARIGFEDQKRAGESKSGIEVGEVDGYIVDSQNRNVSIFEAFRLFSADTTVIFEHLDKIAKYDNEALSPVFIVAYCHVENFGALARNYKTLINDRDYVGYTSVGESDNRVTLLEETDQLWIGSETRLRGPRAVVFYHMLLNFR
ncbi:hypothetical protein [Paraburkholderia dipogonis]|uniref:hypothetical protein n=1 Tax=Paraburkholderia dipogonis TaxID=1211383 RepID=UPI0038B84FF3